EENYNLAIREQLDIPTHEETEQPETFAAHFLDTALKEAAHLLQVDSETLRSGGYNIHTTLDTGLQSMLTEQMDAKIKTDSEIEIGAISQNPENGAIQALLGGRNYTDSKFNRAIQARRMPGSTFKP